MRDRQSALSQVVPDYRAAIAMRDSSRAEQLLKEIAQMPAEDEEVLAEFAASLRTEMCMGTWLLGGKPPSARFLAACGLAGLPHLLRGYQDSGELWLEMGVVMTDHSLWSTGELGNMPSSAEAQLRGVMLDKTAPVGQRVVSVLVIEGLDTKLEHATVREFLRWMWRLSPIIDSVGEACRGVLLRSGCRGLDALAACGQDEEVKIRLASMFALAESRCGESGVREALLRGLEDENGGVRAHAAASLRERGEVVAADLQGVIARAIRDGPPEERREAMVAIARWPGDREWKSGVLSDAAAQDPDEGNREKAASLLRHFEAEERRDR